MGKTLMFLGLLLSVFLLGCSSFISAPVEELEFAISEQTAVEKTRDDFGMAAPQGAPLMEEFISSQSKAMPAMADDASMDRGAVAEGLSPQTPRRWTRREPPAGILPSN